MDKINYKQKINSQYVSPTVKLLHLIVEDSVMAASCTGNHEAYKSQNVDDFWI